MPYDVTLYADYDQKIRIEDRYRAVKTEKYKVIGTLEMKADSITTTAVGGGADLGVSLTSTDSGWQPISDAAASYSLYSGIHETMPEGDSLYSGTLDYNSISGMYISKLNLDAATPAGDYTVFYKAVSGEDTVTKSVTMKISDSFNITVDSAKAFYAAGEPIVINGKESSESGLENVEVLITIVK